MLDTQWEIKSRSTNKRTNELPTLLVDREEQLMWASHVQNCDTVGPRVTEEVHILHSITKHTFRLFASWFASGVPEIFAASTVH